MGPGDIELVQFIGYDSFFGCHVYKAKETKQSKSSKEWAVTRMPVQRLLDDSKLESLFMRHLHHGRQFQSPYLWRVRSSFYHPNHNEVWVVQSYCAKGLVSDIIEMHGSPGLPEKLVVYFLKDILVALEQLHSVGIVHGAVIPTSMAVDDQFRARLGGFHHLCCLDEGPVNQWHSSNWYVPCRGLISTAAPEVILQDLDGYDMSADIYSLGVSLLAMLTGTTPFDDLPAGAVMLRKATTLPVCDFASIPVSDHLRDFLELCLRPDPYYRPTASELLQHQLFRKSKRSTIPKDTDVIDADKRIYQVDHSFVGADDGEEPALPHFMSRVSGKVLDPHQVLGLRTRHHLSRAATPDSLDNPSPVPRYHESFHDDDDLAAAALGRHNAEDSAEHSDDIMEYGSMDSVVIHSDEDSDDDSEHKHSGGSRIKGQHSFSGSDPNTPQDEHHVVMNLEDLRTPLADVHMPDS